MRVVQSHLRQHQRKQQEIFPADSPMADLQDINLSSHTRHQYLVNLKLFFDSLGLQGSLDKQSREFLTRAKTDKEWAQNGLKYFIRDKKRKAEEGQIAESTVRNFCKPVKLFCEVHEIELSWKKIKNIIPKGRRYANDRAPTREEIGQVIEYPDRRIKPLVLTECSSGIRVGAWEYLKWKHIEPIKRDDRIVAAKIIVYAGEYEQYFSFMTPEAFKAMQEWMDYRKKCGEEITGESWVMRTLWDTTTPAFNSTINSSRKMGQSAVRGLMERALKAQCLRKGLDLKVTRRYEWKANHGFRKFFQTNCEPKMKSLDVMTLMGQDTGLAASYNKPTVEMLLTEYLKAVDNLTINMVQTDEEMIKNQQALAVEMQTKDKEIQELRDKMAKMEESQLKITELLEVMKIAKSSDGRVGKDRTMLDEKRTVTIG
ncbi:MAG: hypothetical protein WCC17_21135, partial [Candidatus Nitrosopolaris sp.]